VKCGDRCWLQATVIDERGLQGDDKEQPWFGGCVCDGIVCGEFFKCGSCSIEKGLILK
jgi:hypothetical protein